MSGGGHVPVLLAETLEALSVKAGGRYVDGTFGRGGHARAMAQRGAEVLGIDRDDDAIAAAGGMRVVKGRHGDLKEIAERAGWNVVDGILLDLGVSSPQLDEADRGFSFMRSGPLDMRMDRSAGETAEDIVNGWDADSLAALFREFGEEPSAAKIAKAVVAERAKGRKFGRTDELADFIVKTVGRKGAKHPATRVFQALRMQVNDEIGELKRALEGGMQLLKSGGRFAVITFESISDRTVKNFFKAHVGRMESLMQGGERWIGEIPRAVRVTKRAVTARDEEQKANPRSRSAKLRVIERI